MILPTNGGTLMYFGEGKVDQTAQGVRFKGEFDTNMALFLGGTLRYVAERQASMNIRQLAQELARDYKNVHTDVSAL
jgi:hypothetical protein